MNIFNNEKRKLLCVRNDDDVWGYGQSSRLLTVGAEYTFVKAEVHNYNTAVILEEFPDVRFNSVLFEEIY